MTTTHHFKVVPSLSSDAPPVPQSSSAAHWYAQASWEDLLTALATVRSTLVHLKSQIARGGASTIGLLSILNRLCEIAVDEDDMLHLALGSVEQGRPGAALHTVLAYGTGQTAELATLHAALQRLVEQAAHQAPQGSGLARHLAANWPAALAHVTCSLVAVNLASAQHLLAHQGPDAITTSSQEELADCLQGLCSTMTAAIAALDGQHDGNAPTPWAH